MNLHTTVLIWWDEQVPEQPGWSYTLTETDAEGRTATDSGPLTCPADPAYTDDELIALFRRICPDYADIEDITIEG